MIKKILIGFFLLLFVLGAGGYLYYKLIIEIPPLISESDRKSLQIMPLPAKVELVGESYVFDKNFGVSFTDVKSPRLERAVNRFLLKIRAKTGIDMVGKGSGLRITCHAEGHKFPTLSDDESYTLNVGKDGIVLEANTESGILHGLESISQLANTKSIPSMTLTDSPRFPWRGIMIDVSRHWIPKEVILRNLDAMAAVKMNVLHLHLSDDQGFRVESKIFPLLHEKGSNGKYYTQEDIKEIIQYASDRGIRILPEFDVPGHTKSWLIAYPEYASAPGPFYFGRKAGDNLFSVPMDPTNENTYTFLDKFFGEMSNLFPDEYLHIGGDEVNGNFWGPETYDFMNKNGLENAHDLQAYFNRRLQKIIQSHGKIMVGWEEILDSELMKDVVIQSWKNQKSLFQGVQQGNKAILSAGFYLDHKLHADWHYGIDPLILPGAVDIEPDTGQWKMYDMIMQLPGDEVESQLVVFDRDPENVFGYFAFLDRRTAFNGGIIENGNISFSFDAGIGILDFDAEFIKDSISGNVLFGILKFASQGKISGGSHMPGTNMPKIEVVKPLTPDQENNILGAEAAMWSEVVSAKTIDSRIWPRSAAIAEKLWSPSSLTTDTDDMYRRLSCVSQHLANMGITHISNGEELIREIGGEAYLALKEIVEVMEESKYYDRLSDIIEKQEIYLPNLSLNSIADAAAPESLSAREFNALVHAYKENPDDEKKENIIEYLKKWTAAYNQLLPLFNQSERMIEIKGLAEKLSYLSIIALTNIQDGVNEGDAEIEDALSYLEKGENGVVVAVVPGLRELLNN